MLTINHDFKFLAEFVGAYSTHIILLLILKLNLVYNGKLQDCFHTNFGLFRLFGK